MQEVNSRFWDKQLVTRETRPKNTISFYSKKELDPTYESIELPVSWQKASVYGYRRSYLSGKLRQEFLFSDSSMG